MCVLESSNNEFCYIDFFKDSGLCPVRAKELFIIKLRKDVLRRAGLDPDLLEYSFFDNNLKPYHILLKSIITACLNNENALKTIMNIIQIARKRNKKWHSIYQDVLGKELIKSYNYFINHKHKRAQILNLLYKFIEKNTEIALRFFLERISDINLLVKMAYTMSYLEQITDEGQKNTIINCFYSCLRTFDKLLEFSGVPKESIELTLKSLMDVYSKLETGVELNEKEIDLMRFFSNLMCQFHIMIGVTLGKGIIQNGDYKTHKLLKKIIAQNIEIVLSCLKDNIKVSARYVLNNEVPFVLQKDRIVHVWRNTEIAANFFNTIFKFSEVMRNKNFIDFFKNEFISLVVDYIQKNKTEGVSYVIKEGENGKYSIEFNYKKNNIEYYKTIFSFYFSQINKDKFMVSIAYDNFITIVFLRDVLSIGLPIDYLRKLHNRFMLSLIRRNQDVLMTSIISSEMHRFF